MNISPIEPEIKEVIQHDLRTIEERTLLMASNIKSFHQGIKEVLKNSLLKAAKEMIDQLNRMCTHERALQACRGRFVHMHKGKAKRRHPIKTYDREYLFAKPIGSLSPMTPEVLRSRQDYVKGHLEPIFLEAPQRNICIAAALSSTTSEPLNTPANFTDYWD